MTGFSSALHRQSQVTAEERGAIPQASCLSQPGQLSAPVDQPRGAIGPTARRGLRGALPRSGVLLSSLQRIYGTTGIGAGSPPSRPPEFARGGRKSEGHPLASAVVDAAELDPVISFVRSEDEGDEFPAPEPGAAVASWPPRSAADEPPAGYLPRAGVEDEHSVAGGDRRGFPRHESNCLVAVCPYDGDEKLGAEKVDWMLHAARLRGRVIDVSMSGLAFRLPETIDIGAKVLLRISHRALSEHVDASATIVRSHPSRESGWDLVCRFDRHLTFEQIHLIGRNLFAATIV